MTVSGYDPSQGSNSKRIVNAIIAYDHHSTGETILISINQAIEVHTMDHNLLSPIQIRVAGNIVNDVPKFLQASPKDLDHTITLSSPDHDDLVIPLQLDGVTSYFPSRKPTEDEMLNHDLPRYDLTANSPDWNP